MIPILSTSGAVFDNRDQAETAVKDLYQQGFRDDEIGMVIQQKETLQEKTEAKNPPELNIVDGAGIGLLVGASLGGVLTGAGVVPAAIAGGLVMSMVEGGVAGSVIGALIEMGMPAEEARSYERELKAGQTIVTVNANGRSDKALEVLRRHGGRPCESPAAMSTLEFCGASSTRLGQSQQ